MGLGLGLNFNLFFPQPIRPNSIGLSMVELIKHERNTIWVRGLDALDTLGDLRALGGLGCPTGPIGLGRPGSALRSAS